jgi:hypothetical protein
MGNSSSNGGGSSGGGYSARGLGFNRKGGDDPFTPSFTPSYTPPPKTESSHSYISKALDVVKEAPLISQACKDVKAEINVISNWRECDKAVTRCINEDTSSKSYVQKSNECHDKNESICHNQELHNANREFVTDLITKL